MRWIGNLAVAVVFWAVTLRAQTNANTTTTNSVRPISLEESIHLALAHNLGLQIERYAPQIAAFKPR